MRAGDLAQALGFVAAAAPRRTTIPILANCLLEGDGERLSVTATDLDVLMRAEIESDSAFTATVPCHRLRDLLAALPADVDVRLHASSERLVIKAARGHWWLPIWSEALPALDLPGDGVVRFTLAADELARLVKRLRHAISTEKTRFYLTGVYLEPGLTATATDGHRLVRIRSPLDVAVPRVIIPGHTIELLRDGLTGDVTCAVADGRIGFTADGRTLISKLIDATYPDCARVIPAESGNKITLDSAALASAVRRLLAVAEDEKLIPTLGLAWDVATAYVCLARAPDSHEEMEPVSAAGIGHVGLNPRYLLEQLAALGGELVALDHEGGGGPVRISRPDEPDTTSVIMPLRW